MNRHLNEDELLSLVEGTDGNAAAAEHAANCAECGAEVLTMRQALGDFAVAVRTMAAETAPALSVPAQAETTSWRGGLGFAWAGGLVAAVAIAAGTMTLPVQRVQDQAPPRMPQGVEDAQITDEALLEGINADLTTRLPPSLAPLAPADATGARNSTVR